MSTYINPEAKDGFRVDTLDAPSFLREYLNYALIIKNLTERSVMNYYTQIREFLQWTQCRYEPGLRPEDVDAVPIAPLPFSVLEEVTREDIVEYLSFIQVVNKNGASTRSVKLTALKGLFKYYTDIAKRLPSDPAKDIGQPKREKRLPKYLTEVEAVTLLRTVQEHPVSECPERDFCMLTFMLNCGMRLSELVGLDVTDIRDTTMRIFGKGRKERQVYLNAACVSALNKWLDARKLIKNATREPALFISKRTGGRLTSRRVEQIVEKMLMVAGLSGQGYSPHKLRHTAATLMKRAGTDVLELRQILGHESIATTEIYTHLEEAQIREAMENSPLANFEA